MFKNKLGKKVIVALMTISMIASLGACGNNDNKSNNGNKATTSSSDTKKDNSSTSSSSDKKTKISVYRASFNITAPIESDLKAVQDKINEYIGDKINVEVELNDISSGEYQEKANLALVGGEIDLLWTASWEEVIGTDDVVKQNAVYDLTDKLPNYDIYTALPDWVWGSSAYDGKNYFIPVYKESAEGYCFAFRKDLADKYGWDLSTVTELKDIEPMLADAKAEGIKYPYLSQKTGMFYRYYLNDYDFFSQDSFIAVDKAKNEVVNTVLTEDYLEFCTLMADWAEKGYLHEDDLTKTTTDTTMMTQDWGVTWWTNIPNNDEASTRWQQDVVMAQATENWLQSNGTLGSCYCVSSQCSDEEVDACLKFISLLYTDQTLADLYTFGIEGTHYNLVDGKVSKVKDAGYNHSMWESVAVTNLSLEEGEPDNKVELYEKFNNEASDSVADGFRFDVSSIESEYSACQQAFNEYGYVLENGGFAVADVKGAIQNYQKALDNAGYQKVLAEFQKQYNEWLKVK